MRHPCARCGANVCRDGELNCLDCRIIMADERDAWLYARTIERRDAALARARTAGLTIVITERNPPDAGWVIWHGGGGTRRRTMSDVVAYIEGLIDARQGATA